MAVQQQAPYENTSGMGDAAVIPPGVKGWSWGAFFLNWIWGIGNNVFIALLMFVPLVNLVMVFVLGAKGREWAWRRRRWLSIEEFQRTQRKWSIAGLIVWGAAIIIIPTAFHYMFKGQKELALTLARQNPEIVQLLGEPLQTGWFSSGKISTNEIGSCAIVSVPLSGSKAEGRMHIASVGEGESWLVVQAVLVSGKHQIFAIDRPDIDKYMRLLRKCQD